MVAWLNFIEKNRKSLEQNWALDQDPDHTWDKDTDVAFHRENLPGLAAKHTAREGVNPKTGKAWTADEERNFAKADRVKTLVNEQIDKGQTIKAQDLNYISQLTGKSPDESRNWIWMSRMKDDILNGSGNENEEDLKNYASGKKIDLDSARAELLGFKVQQKAQGAAVDIVDADYLVFMKQSQLTKVEDAKKAVDQLVQKLQDSAAAAAVPTESPATP